MKIIRYITKYELTKCKFMIAMMKIDNVSIEKRKELIRDYIAYVRIIDTALISVTCVVLCMYIIKYIK